MIPKAPTTFADIDGREWTCQITVSSLERCRDAGGVDPMKFVVSNELWRGVFDPIVIADIVWFSVEQDATSRGISKTKFKDSLRSDAIIAARDAWFNAFAAFLPSRMGEALLKDKAEVQQHFDNRLSASPNNGGTTSTDVPGSSE